jgi:hypothetical protein
MRNKTEEITPLERIHTKVYPKNDSTEKTPEEREWKIKGYQLYSGINEHINRIAENLEKNKVNENEHAPFMLAHAATITSYINDLTEQLKKDMLFASEKKIFMTNLVAFQTFSYELAKPLYTEFIVDQNKKFLEYKKELENVDIYSNIRFLTIKNKRFDFALKKINEIMSQFISEKTDRVLLQE